MLSSEYKVKFGNKSLVSDEYRLSRSIKYSGENNPNFGNNMSNDNKLLISSKNKNKKPWNKGLKVIYTEKQKEAIKKREEKYKNGLLKRPNKPLSTETRDKISKSVRIYSENNKDEIKLRAVKSIKTKIDNGYYEKRKINTINKYKEACINYGFTVNTIEDTIAILECIKCDTTHSRSIKSVIHNNMCPMCSTVGTSTYETEILNELKKLVDTPIFISDKTILKNLELDLLLPAYNLAIEINGLYWHSEKAGKGKFYHKYKTDKCKEAGIQLIHIFEDEWLYKKDICIERLKSKLKLSSTQYARKLTVKEITNKEAYEFLTKHHIQGRGVAATYCYALFDGNNIHAVMTFSNLSIAKGGKHVIGTYELNRYASIGTVVGGASKLFSHFIKNVNPIQIISYSDERWNTGELYNKLKFKKIGTTLPGYWYVNGTHRIHRFKLRKTSADDPAKTEKELRESEGYTRIWDCGHSKWMWKNE